MALSRLTIWIRVLCGVAILACGALSQPPPSLAQKPAFDLPSESAPASDALLAESMREIQNEVRALSGRVELLIQALRDRPVDQGIQEDSHDLQLAFPEFSEVWNLSLHEAISISLQNSKVIRNLGGVAQFGFTGKEQTLLARVNEDVSLATFESSLRNLVSDIENTYWDCWLGWQETETAQELRESAQALWNEVHETNVIRNSNTSGEAQAREQYFFARAQLEAAQQRLYDSESRLRFLLGLAPSDGRLIRPSDEPDRSEPTLLPLHKYPLDDLPEIARQRSKIDELLKTGTVGDAEGRRPAQRNIVREEAVLGDMKLNASHLIAAAIRRVDFTYSRSRTHFNRWRASEEEVGKLLELFKRGLTEIDLVLDAQRRKAQNANDARRAAADFEKAKSELQLRTLTLLDHHGLQVVQDRAVDDAREVRP